jgi:hypothetical protein
MRCPYCHRPVHLLDPRRPLRLLLPRCRFCRRHALSWVHKALLFVLGIAALYLLIGLAFMFREGR